MHYWIDGYNLLFYLPKIPGSFEEKRRFLILQIEKLVEKLSLSVTIVFDASDPVQNYDTRTHLRSLEIIYTHPRKSADDAILEAVELHKNPSQICVVTSDKGLSIKAKALGAEILPLSEFLLFLQKKEKKKNSSKSFSFQDSPREIERLLKIFSHPPKDI
jgi:predicted RNA-binding protein with PIN domain